MARVSQLFNVMSKTTLDAIISPKNNGERELAHQHFHWINSDDLVLLDRGYAAFWLFKSIVTKQAHFCARICNTQWKPIRKFFHSGAKEKIVTIHPAFYALKKCRELGLDTEPLKLRLVRIDLENGDTEILITSLLNTLIFPQSEFAGLYHLRWSVEEDYKIIKQRLEVENFSGKTVLSVYQDFHAKVFTKNLTAVISYPVNKEIKNGFGNRQHHYKLNFTQVLSRMKDTVVLLFTNKQIQIETMLEKLFNLFMTLIEPIRQKRKYPRNHKLRGRVFFTCYKPIR